MFSCYKKDILVKLVNVMLKVVVFVFKVVEVVLIDVILCKFMLMVCVQVQVLDKDCKCKECL